MRLRKGQHVEFDVNGCTHADWRPARVERASGSVITVDVPGVGTWTGTLLWDRIRLPQRKAKP